MERIKGRAVTGGIVFGRIVFYHRGEQLIKKNRVSNLELELSRYEYAKRMAMSELDVLYEREIENIGKDHADIFMIHKMLLEDDGFVGRIEEIIRHESCNADYAVFHAANEVASELGHSEDEYIRARTADVKDVSRRLIRHIQNKSESELKFEKNSILCAYDIEPSETVAVDKDCVKAICTCYGSVNSHASILSRSMNIPTVVALGRGLVEELEGCEAVVDGYAGVLYIDPDDETKRRMIEKREEEGRKRELLKRLKGRKNITLDGTEVEVHANISGLFDMKYVLENDAGGIGLFRSEFLYLQNDDFPDEELQFYTYRRALEKMEGKPVIIRTLDIGVDKNPDYLDDIQQDNPAMGLRSIRICFERPDIFRTQLRALYRASVYGRLAILFPMIVDPEEIIAIKGIIQDVCEELDAEGVPYSSNVELGIMIETPAAVMLSDELAREVDFFSVGTNDLEQYTIAVDRQDSRLEKYCRPHHMAVLRMIKMAADSAHRYGKWIGVCGELAGDTELTELLLSMGIDELSVSPSRLLLLRRKIRSISLTDKLGVLVRHGVVRADEAYDLR
ncbi:MAG: phosphoenolpyruvate--protein phosphotransferase [Ruminococcus sp.]|nr:phosphoenolpyruvate--protein phosphotransferase [Ruminococcus sp.]